MSADPQTLEAWAEHVGDEPAGGLAAHALEVYVDGVTGPVVREPLTDEQFRNLATGGRLGVQFNVWIDAEDMARRGR